MKLAKMEDLLRYTVNWAEGSLSNRDDKRHIDHVEAGWAELCGHTLHAGSVQRHVRMYEGTEYMLASPAATHEEAKSAKYTKMCKVMGAYDEPGVHNTVVDPGLDWSCDWPNGVRPISSDRIDMTVRCQAIGNDIGESYKGEDDKTEQCHQRGNVTPMLENGITNTMSHSRPWARSTRGTICGQAQDMYYEREFHDVGELEMYELNEGKEKDALFMELDDIAALEAAGYTDDAGNFLEIDTAAALESGKFLERRRLYSARQRAGESIVLVGPKYEVDAAGGVTTVDRQNTTDGEAAGLECGDILRQTGAMRQLKHRRTC